MECVTLAVWSWWLSVTVRAIWLGESVPPTRVQRHTAWTSVEVVCIQNNMTVGLHIRDIATGHFDVRGRSNHIIILSEMCEISRNGPGL